ncbi:MAG: M28 family peptidase [Bacteroidota bacterium]
MIHAKVFLTSLTLLVLLPIYNSQGQEIDTLFDARIYDEFMKHLEYLASDELEGRGIGSLGYDRAADYVAAEFANNDLKPLLDSDSYFQGVALSKLRMKPGSFHLEVAKGSDLIAAEYGSEVSAVMSPKYLNVDKQQSLVFAGYGNIIPEKNIDDYAGLDVKGKTVIVALGGPKDIDHPDFGNRNAKFRNAVDRGASGLILYYPKAAILQNVIFNKVHGFLSEDLLSLTDTTVVSLVNVDLNPLLFTKKGFVKDILEVSGLNLKKELKKMENGERVSRILSSDIETSYRLSVDPVASKNIIGLLPGADPELKNEYIVIGAHLDGLGIGKPVKGDSIYNGMLDNCSGVSAILSISKAFSQLPNRPKRSIIFICYTAEETGLLGSSYFATHHGITDGKIVANLNIDMLAQTIETKDMAPLGYSHSTLSEATDFAADQLGLEIDDNKKAEFDYIERSDQLSFIKKGIPSLFVSAGFTASDPTVNGEKTFTRWMKKIYDSPLDGLDQKYSDKAFLTALKFNFLTLYYAANSLKEVKWNKEGWLYKKYMADID